MKCLYGSDKNKPSTNPMLKFWGVVHGMILKVLIVDDDIIAQTSLKTMIDWGKNGYEICGDASNGNIAIQMLNSIQPDIVFTDMSMPVLDGIGLIEYIEQKHSEIKIIALSGYDDFNYVKQSMKKGAIDYILKHNLDSAMLLSVLESARKTIVEEQQDTVQKRKQQEQLIQGRVLLAQRFIRKMVEGQITDQNEIRDTIQSLCLNIDLRNLLVITAEIDGFFQLKERNMDVFIQSLSNIGDEVMKDFCKALISYMGEGKFIIIVSLGRILSYQHVHNQLIEIIYRIKSSVKRYLNVTLSFGVSSICEDIASIAEGYLEANQALKDKFYTGKDSILWQNSYKSLKETLLTLDFKDEMNIKVLFKSMNRTCLTKYLDDLFDKIIRINASYKSVKIICAELITIADTIAKELGIKDSFMEEYENIPYENLNKYDTIYDIKRWIMDIYDKLLSLIEFTKINKNYSQYIKKACEFINKNFQNNISLQDVADYVGVSHQYLSKLFKEECSMGFIDFVNLIKVEHAKLLIESGDYKLKDIIFKVGFNNYNYFFKVFKDTLGMTPAEFEKSL